jgi:predicted SAM-dependent methyltransferase
MRIIMVNNGNHDIKKHLNPEAESNIILLEPKQNLGWTGGIAEGLKHSKSKYVMFANDDIYVPIGQVSWLNKLVKRLDSHPKMAAVGPSSNVVMGNQNIFSDILAMQTTTPFLIGFCILLKRSALDEAGGIDESMVTGDDIDLSMRLRAKGYSLMVDHSVFIYHHGFQTGEKIYGKPNAPGGWNSKEMGEETKTALIKKHGFKKWWAFMTKPCSHSELNALGKPDREHVKSLVNGCKPEEIVDLGCGGDKTIEGSIGVDIIEKGQVTESGNGLESKADVVADVTGELPFEDGRFKVVIARHILEHCIDPIEALKNWGRIMHDSGDMIVSLPNEGHVESMQYNKEHQHSYTPESFANLATTVGYKIKSVSDRHSPESFTVVLNKQ